MNRQVGGHGVFPGSFNPPHIGHIQTIRAALECFDTLHMFVRFSEGVDLVDWETKRGWFDRINEETGRRLVIHRMENRAVTGKTYTMEDFFAFIRDTVRSVGEPVSGFVFGDDYGELIPVFQQEFPELYFPRGVTRPSFGGKHLCSTDIRKDLEGHRDCLPPYVYETLHLLKEAQAGPDIDISGCQVVGRGFGSTVYALDDQTIVKVCKEGTPFEKVQQEYILSRSASLAGVPSVRVFRIAMAGGAYGLVLERLSSSLGLAIHEHPEQMEAYVDQYAALAKKLHAARVPDDTIPSIKDRWLSYAGGLERWCSPDEAALVHGLISRMPEGDTFLHGDLHPGNIMFRGDEPVLIDMAALARGSCLCDLAVVYRGLIMGPRSEQRERREKGMGMSADEMRRVGDLFFMKYLGLGSREELEDVYSRLHMLYALSVVVMCGSGRMKDEALARLIMDELLRGVVVPGKDTILAIWRDGSLVPGRTAPGGKEA